MSSIRISTLEYKLTTATFYTLINPAGSVGVAFEENEILAIRSQSSLRAEHLHSGMAFSLTSEMNENDIENVALAVGKLPSDVSGDDLTVTVSDLLKRTLFDIRFLHGEIHNGVIRPAWVSATNCTFDVSFEGKFTANEISYYPLVVKSTKTTAINYDTFYNSTLPLVGESLVQYHDFTFASGTDAFNKTPDTCTLSFQNMEAGDWIAGGGVELDGVDEYLEEDFGSSAANVVVPQGDITIFAVCTPKNFAGTDVFGIVCAWDEIPGERDNYELFVDANSDSSIVTLGFFQTETNGLRTISSNTGVVTSDVKQSIAVTISGTTATFYVDSIAQGTDTDTKNDNRYGSTRYIRAARKVGVDTGYFEGSIFNVLVFDRALSAGEIAKLHHQLI